MIREFDAPWKEALDLFLEAFLRYCFPALHAQIDWRKPYRSLDAELQQIVREGELGEKRADKLFQVTLLTGEEIWLLIHIEVQSQRDPQFAWRMFVYYYRILDRYNQRIVSLAVLGDEDPNWRPKEFTLREFGCELDFRFPTVKLIDYRDRLAELEVDSNPITLIVLAHLKSLLTASEPEERRESKFELLRNLFERGYEATTIRELFRLIDWFLELPRELEQQLHQQITHYEEEREVPYVTSFERIAREQGRQEGRQERQEESFLEGFSAALELKFGAAGLEFVEELREIHDPAALSRVRKAILSTNSIDELRALLTQP